MNKLATFLLAGLLGSCAPSAADLDQTRGGQVEVYFNEPGTCLLYTSDAADE